MNSHIKFITESELIFLEPEFIAAIKLYLRRTLKQFYRLWAK